MRLWPENHFFELCPRFKFNILGLALGMALRFYTRVTKELKIKVRRFWGLIPKLVGGLFAPLSWSWIELKQTKIPKLGITIPKYSLECSYVLYRSFWLILKKWHIHHLLLTMRYSCPDKLKASPTKCFCMWIFN